MIRYKNNLTVPFLYCYCTATVLLLYCYCTTTVLLLYCYCTATVLLLYGYYTATVRLLYCYWTATGLLLCCYWTATVLLLYCCCTAAVLLLYCYCTATVLLLYSYTVRYNISKHFYGYELLKQWDWFLISEVLRTKKWTIFRAKRTNSGARRTIGETWRTICVALRAAACTSEYAMYLLCTVASTLRCYG